MMEAFVQTSNESPCNEIRSSNNSEIGTEDSNSSKDTNSYCEDFTPVTIEYSKPDSENFTEEYRHNQNIAKTSYHDPKIGNGDLNPNNVSYAKEYANCYSHPQEQSNGSNAGYANPGCSSTGPFNYMEEELDNFSASSAASTASYIDNFSAYHEYNNIYVASNQQLDYGPNNLHYAYCVQNTLPHAPQDYYYVPNSYFGDNPGVPFQNHQIYYPQDGNNCTYQVHGNDNSYPNETALFGSHHGNAEPNENYLNFTEESNGSSEYANSDSNWLQSTVNELFNETKSQQPTPVAESSVPPEHPIAKNEAKPRQNEILSPPSSPRANATKTPHLELGSASANSNGNSYLCYVPMRVSRNPDNGDIQMQYDYPPTNLIPHFMGNLLAEGVKSMTESSLNKRNPPKTVRELLDEYRHRSYLPDPPGLKYVPFGTNMSAVCPSILTEQNVPNLVPPSTPEPPVNVFYNSPHVLPSSSNSGVSMQSSGGQDYRHFYEDSFEDQQHQLQVDEPGHVTPLSAAEVIRRANSTVGHDFSDAGRTSTPQSKLEAMENPLTPADTDSSLPSPAQSEDTINLLQTNLPGIHHIRRNLLPHFSMESFASAFESPAGKNPEIQDLTVIPNFVEGHIDAKEHRPRHFDMLELEIGDFKVIASDVPKKTSNKFKVLFCKRRFVYEFNWPFPVENVSQTAMSTELTFVHVPFHSIEALKCTDNTITVYVNSKPRVLGGLRQASFGIISSAQAFDTKARVDNTYGQIATTAIHKITMKIGQMPKLRNFLISFDKRFWYLLQREIPEGAFQNVQLPDGFETTMDLSGVKRANDKKCASNEKKKICKVPPHTCSCKISCRSMRCSCSKLQLKCNEQCQCEQCDNPLNILMIAGKELPDILGDECLMHNVFKRGMGPWEWAQHIGHDGIEQNSCLDSCLYSIIQLKCCDNIVKVCDMIPGQAACPHGCDVFYHYSWCSLKLHDDKSNPRDHCPTCMKCIKVEKDHSELCRKSRHLRNQPKGVLTRRRSQAMSENS